MDGSLCGTRPQSKHPLSRYYNSVLGWARVPRPLVFVSRYMAGHPRGRQCSLASRRQAHCRLTAAIRPLGPRYYPEPSHAFRGARGSPTLSQRHARSPTLSCPYSVTWLCPALGAGGRVVSSTPVPRPHVVFNKEGIPEEGWKKRGEGARARRVGGRMIQANEESTTRR